MVIIIHITIVHQFLVILQLPKYANRYIIAWRNHIEGANRDPP